MPSNSFNKPFSQIFDAYYAPLVAYVAFLIANKDDAEDIVQALFVKLWEEKKYTQIENMKSYLFAAARKRALNYIEHLKVRTKHQNDVLEDNPLSGNSVWNRFIEEEMHQKINHAIEQLPPKMGLVFKARYIDEKSSEEIASQMNISRRTAEKQYENALKRLKASLIEYMLLLFMR